MKRKKVPSQKKSTSLVSMKASEMILKFASDYILMGRTLEERQNGLNSACTAWNLSLLPDRKREAYLQRYISEVRLANPGIDEDECNGIRYNIELLIQEKIRLFPNVYKKMLNAEIVKKGGKEVVTVLSLDHG